jgi:CTP:molybdopterin cytidylyltransferase MocA
MTQPLSFGYAPAPPSTDVRIAGLILAAGKSERMGAPKALLPFRGRTFLENQVALFREVGADPIYVSTSHDLKDRVAKVLAPDVRIAVVDRPDKGQIESVRVGLSAVGGVGHAVLLGLVDQPGVSRATVDGILERWRKTRARVVAPRFDGRRGHPIVIGRAAFPYIFRGEPESLRIALDELDDVVPVDVDDPWILLNVNLPDDYRRLIEFHGSDAEKQGGDPWQRAVDTTARAGAAG